MRRNDSTAVRPLVDLDDLDPAFHAGYFQGRAGGQREASADLARQWLLELAHDMERLAIGNAMAKGPAWARAMREQAQGVDW